MVGANININDLGDAIQGVPAAIRRMFLACAPEVKHVDDKGSYYQNVRIKSDDRMEPDRIALVTPMYGSSGSKVRYLPETHTLYVWDSGVMDSDELRAEACKHAYLHGRRET